MAAVLWLQRTCPRRQTLVEICLWQQTFQRGLCSKGFLERFDGKFWRQFWQGWTVNFCPWQLVAAIFNSEKSFLECRMTKIEKFSQKTDFSRSFCDKTLRKMLMTKSFCQWQTSDSEWRWSRWWNLLLMVIGSHLTDFWWAWRRVINNVSATMTTQMRQRRSCDDADVDATTVVTFLDVVDGSLKGFKAWWKLLKNAYDNDKPRRQTSSKLLWAWRMSWCSGGCLGGSNPPFIQPINRFWR